MSVTLQVLILKSNSEFDAPATTDGEKWKGAMGYLSSCPHWVSSSWGRHHEALDHMTLLVEWQSDGATHEFLRNYYTKFAALLDPLLIVPSSLPQVVDLHQSIVEPYVVPGGYALGSTIVRKLTYDSFNDSQRSGVKTAFSLYDQSLARAADGDAAGYIAGTAAWALDTNKNPTSTLWMLVSWESLDAELRCERSLRADSGEKLQEIFHREVVAPADASGEIYHVAWQSYATASIIVEMVGKGEGSERDYTMRIPS